MVWSGVPGLVFFILLPFILDQFLLPVGDPEEVVLVYPEDVAGAEPTVSERGIRFSGIVFVTPVRC